MGKMEYTYYTTVKPVVQQTLRAFEAQMAAENRPCQITIRDLDETDDTFQVIIEPERAAIDGKTQLDKLNLATPGNGQVKAESIEQQLSRLLLESLKKALRR